MRPLLLLAALLLTGCAANDTTIRTDWFTFQRKSAECGKSVDTNTHGATNDRSQDRPTFPTEKP